MDTGSCSKFLYPQPSQRVRVAWGEGACSSKVHLPLSILFSGCRLGSPRLLDQITLMLFPGLFLKNTLLWKTTEPISMPSGIFERLTGMFFLGFRYFWRFAMQADTCTNALQSLQCVECCKVKRRKGVVCGWRIGVSSSQKETLRHRKCLHFPWPSSSV